ncbi:MAG: glycosyltransferase family 2 protein [Cyclobacteriaceae bacterium]
MTLSLNEILFAFSTFIIVYTYLGYGIIMKLMSLFRNPRSFPALNNEDLPAVTHIIAAYNEEDCIDSKIKNCLAIDYPKHLITTVIVTDGSKDKTCEIVSEYEQVKHDHLPARNGKLAAVNRIMKQVSTPITIFSDANAMLNSQAIKLMITHFQNNRVGAVAGEKIIITGEVDDATAGEGVYWKYESWLKQLDYHMNTLVGAAGELYAVRTHLYESPGKNTLIEDFVMAMKIAAKGYLVGYEPKARAYEFASANIKEESKRKIRISAGGLQAIGTLMELLNPIKYGFLSFQFISHRVLRWSLAPVCLPLVLISNIYLFDSEKGFYILTLLMQSLFYFGAALGHIFETKKIKIKLLFVPYYFIFMNASVYFGAQMLLSGKLNVNWTKAARK